MRLTALILALAAIVAVPAGIARAQTAAQEEHITGADETGNLRYGYTPGYAPSWRRSYSGAEAYGWAPRGPYVHRRHHRYDNR